MGTFGGARWADRAAVKRFRQPLVGLRPLMAQGSLSFRSAA